MQYFGQILNISPVTLIIILAILLLLFGAKKLPELARSMGQSARELKDGFEGKDDDGKERVKDKKEK